MYALAERRYASQEPELRRTLALVDPAREALDVGAWLGPWTRALSRTVRAVHSFEPQAELAARLRRVAAANVTVHHTAVGDEQGTATLLVDRGPGRDALAHLSSTAGPDGGEAVKVPVCRLDDLDLGDVGFVKIDVEGHEAAVLRGAEALLERCRPIVVIEVEQRHLDVPMATTFDWFTSRGWHGWFLRDGHWQPLATFDVDHDQHRWAAKLPHRRYVNNFLFLPTDRPPAG